MSRNTRNTPEKEWVKIVSRPLYQIYRSTMDATLWQVRLNGSGNYLRRRFRASSLENALVEAPRIAGLESRPTDHQFPLVEAFTMTLENTNRRERSRKDWLKTVEKFMVWLKKTHPLCTHWGLMNRQILREYLNRCYAGKSANYRRLAMQPLLQTAAFMHREYDFPAMGERLGIGNKLKNPPKMVYVQDVYSLLDFLRKEGSHLEVGAALQGLAGLQLLEALRLTWSKVDLERGLIEISGETKNEYRNRVIPVCGRVLDALKRANQVRLARKDKVLSLVEFVVVGAKGQTYEDHPSYSRQMGCAFRRWNPAIEWAPKDLRNCLPTFAKMEGIHGTIWEQYIGHAPGTVTDRHYVPRLAARTMGEQNALDRAMELFRKFVVVPVEGARVQPGICNFLQVAASEGSDRRDSGALS